MKNSYSFFYLKKIVRLKHSEDSSLFFSKKKIKKSSEPFPKPLPEPGQNAFASLAGQHPASEAKHPGQSRAGKKKVTQIAKNRMVLPSTTKLCYKNVLLYILVNKIQKTILQKVNLNFQKNIKKKSNSLKKSFLNQCKKNIQSTYSLKKILNSKFTCWPHSTFMKIPTKFFYLNKLNLYQICRNIPIKIEKTLNISNIFTNFHKIFVSIFTKWQKTFLFFFKEEVFLPREKTLFYSNNMNKKQEIKNDFCLLQKKYLKKKMKFAIFLFQIFLKKIQKSFEKILSKFFLKSNFFDKNLNFLFIQLFLELQFSLFLIIKNFQSFFIEQNVLQIFLKKQFLKKKKEIFSFFFKDISLPQVNYKKPKILDFLLVFGLQHFVVVSNKHYFVKNKRNFHIHQKISRKKKFFFSRNQKLTFSKKQKKKLFSFRIWKFLWKNLPEYINKKTSKLLYTLNTQNKQKTKSCFLFSHNILKLGQIFSLFFYFTKTNFCKIFAKNNFFWNFKKNCWHRRTFRRPNLSTSAGGEPEQHFISTCQSSIDLTPNCQAVSFYKRKVAWDNLNRSFESNRCKNHNTFQKILKRYSITNLEKNFSTTTLAKPLLTSPSLQGPLSPGPCQHPALQVIRLPGYGGRVALATLAQPFSLNQMFYVNKNSILNKTQKKMLYSFLKFIKKNTQIFFEYFCVLNCLKTHIEFFSNGNDFQILSHQQLKFSFFHFQQKNKTNMKICMQSLIYSDYLTFFSFFQGFPTRNIQKYKNYSFFNIFSIFVDLCSIKKIENLYKIDKIYLLNNLNKTFCETNIQKFFKCFQKKIVHLERKSFYSQKKQTKMLLPNQMRIFDESSVVLFKLFSCFFEKILFHLYKTSKLQQIKMNFSKKSFFVSFFNFLCFQNFCMKNKFFQNSLFKPINSVYKHYYENFLLFYSMIYLFINHQKFLKNINIYFHKYHIFTKWFLKNFKNIQICTKNFVLKNIPSIYFYKIFSLNISKKQKSTINLLRFQKTFWLLSTKILLKSTKLYKKYFFSFSAFFSSFFIQKSQNGISYLQKKVRKNVFVVKNDFHLNFEGYSVSFFIWKKNSQTFFVFQKNKTSQNIQSHLKQCQQILKNSIGKKQLFFMKKLQRKMKIWCQEYKNNVYNCQLNSTFAKLSAKKTFHYCDLMLFKYLWNWAQKTHPNKNKLWIKKKYFHFIHSKKWFFGKKVGKVFICLPLHSQTKI